MWNSTAYGGMQQNYEQSGGFINSTNYGSPGLGSQNEKRKNEKVNNVIPCTVAQILKASDTDENLKVGSMAAHMLTLVGMVKAVDEQSTRIVYTLDDMTGPPLEVHMWLGESDEITSERRSSIMENSYIRVTGSIRMVKGNKFLTAFKVSPLKEVNEITMHLLEVMHTTMAVAVMDNQAPVTATSNGTTMVHNNYGMGQNSMYSSVSGKEPQYGVMGGLNKQQQLVFQLISSDQSTEGISFDRMFASLKTLNKQTIREAVDFLSNEGHIYSTIDDDHFKSTDSG